MSETYRPKISNKVNVCPECGNPFPLEVLLTPRHACHDDKKSDCIGSGKPLKIVEARVVRPKGDVLHLFNK